MPLFFSQLIDANEKEKFCINYYSIIKLRNSTFNLTMSDLVSQWLNQYLLQKCHK